ncbi:MAG: LysM peptidoglycan-binding domain-containing protein, partial [Treponema sp.]|nr:LysM peptidoglycan-binding domain-containing protein [Treponema sp.]
KAKGKEKQEKAAERKSPWPLVIVLGILVILICLALFFFLIRDRNITGQETAKPGTGSVESARPVTPPPVTPPAPPVTPPPAPPPAPVAPPPAVVAPAPPVIQAPAQAKPVVTVSRKRNPPVRSYKVPATIPKNGVAYKIRWGDTLWDIAEAFYRNPWLYPRIARYNGIKNPDRIISGRTIRIPPKN